MEKPSIRRAPYGELPDGRHVHAYTLRNTNALSATILDYGGIITELWVPDRDGDRSDVVLGKDSLSAYLEGHPHFGAITGRVAGRISQARFELEGRTYPLTANNGPNTLHGGPDGYDKQLWEASIVEEGSVERLRLAYRDPDGANGFPGSVDCTVTYTLLDDDSLEVVYTATSDRATPFNITNHSYFNLAGAGNGTILNHNLRIFSGETAVTDEAQTLLGRREAVREGYNDFREPVRLGTLPRLDTGNADTHYFLEDGRTAHPKPAAHVYEPSSGRTMEVLTTEPGLQFYAGLTIGCDGPEHGKNGQIYEALAGLCLETQDYPDSVNAPTIGGAVLRPEAPFQSVTLFRFKAGDAAD